jgi:site-specific DNA recombinase
LTDAHLRAAILLDEYERRRRDLEQKEQALAEQEALLSGEAERQTALTGLASSIDAFCQRQDSLATATFEQKRQLVLLLIDRVIVTDGKVEIRYVIPTTSASEQIRFCHLRKDYFDHSAFRNDGKSLLSGRFLDDFDC